nr:RHS repeat-associated core domain-containing protein [Duganella sp. Root198D2]
MATQVEYFNGATSLGVSLQSPFSLTLNELAAGTYQVIAKVTTTDPANPVLQSAPLVVTVGNASGAATAYFIHTDQLNTPRAITNGSGNLVWQWDSDPYGKDAANAQPAGQLNFTFNQRFPGQQFDRESNLHYNYYRDYDPQFGRYLQSDPIGLEGGMNTYGYTEANPIIYADPNGLSALGFGDSGGDDGSEGAAGTCGVKDKCKALCTRVRKNLVQILVCAVCLANDKRPPPPPPKPPTPTRPSPKDPKKPPPGPLPGPPTGSN